MRHLLVGGLCAMGLDESGQFLPTVSHAVCDERREAIRLRCGSYELLGESDGIAITEAGR